MPNDYQDGRVAGFKLAIEIAEGFQFARERHGAAVSNTQVLVAKAIADRIRELLATHIKSGEDNTR